MKESIKEFAEFVLPFAVLIALFIIVIVLPIAWFDGHAKSAWLKQSQDIDMPWYQATWLEVRINNQDVKIQNR